MASVTVLKRKAESGRFSCYQITCGGSYVDTQTTNPTAEEIKESNAAAALLRSLWCRSGVRPRRRRVLKGILVSPREDAVIIQFPVRRQTA